MNIEAWQAVVGVAVTAFGAIGGKSLVEKWSNNRLEKVSKDAAKSEDIETYWKNQHAELLLEQKVTEQKVKKLELQLTQIRVAWDMTFDLLIKIDPENKPILTKLKEKINGKIE